jgi:hypothetical protein
VPRRIGDSEEAEEEDIDELDAFAENEDEDFGVQSFKNFANATLPVPVKDGADEKDLREFLEAEKQRKEVCGSEPESDDEPTDDVPEEDYITDQEWLTSTPPATSSNDDENEENYSETSSLRLCCRDYVFDIVGFGNPQLSH